MFKFASSVGLALAVANVKRRIRNIVMRGGFGVAGAVVLVISLCFFLVAGHLYLSQLLNPIASAAIIGGVLLAIALLLFFLASRPMREHARGVENPLGEASEKLKESASRLTEALGPPGSPLRNPAVVIAGLTLVVGFLLGRRGGRSRD